MGFLTAWSCGCTSPGTGEPRPLTAPRPRRAVPPQAAPAPRSPHLSGGGCALPSRLMSPHDFSLSSPEGLGGNSSTETAPLHTPGWPQARRQRAPPNRAAPPSGGEPRGRNVQKWGGRARPEHKHLLSGSVVGQLGCLRQGRTPRASASTGAGRVATGWPGAGKRT